MTETWKAFRVHAEGCQERCERARALVCRGSDRGFDVGELHWLCCDKGEPLLVAWWEAVALEISQSHRVMRLPP